MDTTQNAEVKLLIYNMKYSLTAGNLQYRTVI